MKLIRTLKQDEIGNWIEAVTKTGKRKTQTFVEDEKWVPGTVPNFSVFCFFLSLSFFVFYILLLDFPPF